MQKEESPLWRRRAIRVICRVMTAAVHMIFVSSIRLPGRTFHRSLLKAHVCGGIFVSETGWTVTSGASSEPGVTQQEHLG